MKIEIKAEIELNPFIVPTTVSIKPSIGKRQDGFTLTEMPLSDLDCETLNKMCEQFKDSVLKNAGKKFDVVAKGVNE